MNKRNKNTEIFVIVYLFLALFLSLMAYFAYYVQFDSIDQVNNSYNTRVENLSKRIIRGNITSDDGSTILAGTRIDADGTETRVYPYGNLFSHVVGFSTRGRMGIELLGNISLLTSNADIGQRIANELDEEKNMGDTLVSTLNLELQQVADEALGENRGAVIAMDPQSGQIKALVSHPNFDPNSIVQDWEKLNSLSDQAPLLNRAINGLYPPGSTFKMVTLLEFLRETDTEGVDNYSYNCTGHYTNGDTTINCYHGSVHGNVDISKSFAKSCNSSFANIGSALDNLRFKSSAEGLLFNKEIPFKLSTQQSVFELNQNSDISDKLQDAIGQGKTLVTPIHLLLITSSIANEGVLNKPYLIDRIENYQGVVIKQYKPDEYGRLLSEEEAEKMTTYMMEVVNSGTASDLADTKYVSAGKTGSAEYSTDKSASHAWYTGFADYHGEKLAVTVLVENGGSGSKSAVPIAKKLFDKYYELR